MTKRLVAKLLTVAMIGSAFVGMTGTSVMAEGKPYEGVTLSVWGASTEINDTTLAIMEAATEELGMEFEIEINPGGSDGDNILKTKLAADEVPDLVNWNSGSKFLSVNPEKYFLDLTDEPMTEKFDDAFKSVVSVDGRVYGAPQTTTQAGAVVYWKPDYEELGLEVPKTWADFVANCQALKDAGKTPVYLAAGGSSTWTTQVLFLGDNYNVVSNDPEFPAQFEAGEAKFAENELALASWKKYEDLKDMLNADASAATYEDGILAMGEGEATHWIILTQVVPEILVDYPEAADNLGIFGIPGDDPENHGITVWEPNAWYVGQKSENAEAAKAFLEFWVSEENIDRYVSEYGANGPSCIKGYTLPDTVAPAIREDMQAYFDAGKVCPALEFQTSVKGNSCEQITTAVATGQITGEEAAAQYDADCLKSAIQMGFDWK